MQLPQVRQPNCKESAMIEARYTNYFEVGHNAYEFIVDFGQYQPSAEHVQMQTRIITGPVFAKLLHRLLTQALEQFETEHGVIEQPIDDSQSFENVQPSDGIRQSPPRVSVRVEAESAARHG
jgi:hypothetical protein